MPKNFKMKDLELANVRHDLAQARHLIGILIADLQLNEALVRAYQFRGRRMFDPVSDLEVEEVMVRGRKHNPPRDIERRRTDK